MVTWRTVCDWQRPVAQKIHERQDRPQNAHMPKERSGPTKSTTLRCAWRTQCTAACAAQTMRTVSFVKYTHTAATSAAKVQSTSGEPPTSRKSTDSRVANSPNAAQPARAVRIATLCYLAQVTGPSFTRGHHLHFPQRQNTAEQISAADGSLC